MIASIHLNRLSLRFNNLKERVFLRASDLDSDAAEATACVERIAATSCEAYSAPVSEVGGTVSQHHAR